MRDIIIDIVSSIACQLTDGILYLTYLFPDGIL